MSYKEYLNEVINFDDIKFTYEDEGMFKAVYYNGNALRYRIKKYPNVNYGDPVYEMHVDIKSKDQRKGLALQMLKKFLSIEGVPLWFAKGRITNFNMIKVINKMKKDTFFDVVELDNGYLIYEG